MRTLIAKACSLEVLAYPIAFWASVIALGINMPLVPLIMPILEMYRQSLRAQPEMSFWSVKTGAPVVE